jgi:hypothetical protein
MAFADMMRRKILMPAHLVYDGHDEDLFYHLVLDLRENKKLKCIE